MLQVTLMRRKMCWNIVQVILCLFLLLVDIVDSGDMDSKSMDRIDRAVTIQYSPADKACIDDSDCASLGRQYACFLYKCHNWVDSTPEHSHCHKDEECQKLVSMGEETGMVGTFILDAKCYRHWNSFQVTKGICFSSYSLSQCSSKRDCSDEDECCGSHCCPKPYFQQWQEFTCLFDQQCQLWKTGQYCCSNQQCCDTPREEVVEQNDFHDAIHHKESYHAVQYHENDLAQEDIVIDVVHPEVENVTETLQNETEAAYDDGIIEGISDYHGIADYDEVDTVKKEDMTQYDIDDAEPDYNNFTYYNETELSNSTDNMTDIIAGEYIYEDINTSEHGQYELFNETTVETKQDIKDYEANEEILIEGITTGEIIDDIKDGHNLEGLKDEQDVNNALQNYVVIDIEDYGNASLENITNTVDITSDYIENITTSDDLDNFIVIGYEDYDNLSTINDTIDFAADISIKLTSQELEESDIIAAIEGVLPKETKYDKFEETGDTDSINNYVTKTDEQTTKKINSQKSNRDAIQDLITELAREEDGQHKTDKDSAIEILGGIEKSSKNEEVSLIIKYVTPPDNVETFQNRSADSCTFYRTLLVLFLPLLLNILRMSTL